MVHAYVGKILRVDLSRGKSSVEPLNMNWARMFVGGKGLGAKYLYEELEPRIDAFSPENVLILMTGPLAGTTAPCTAKHVTITKSPQTGAFLDSYAGGYFGCELKFAGFDAVILKGKAKKPVYLSINNDQVQIKDADELWGKDTHETEKLVKEELGDKEVKVASIGPAGENLVRFSCITNDLYRQAGRGGAGAVMGSKNLKAIAVRGTQGVSVPNIDEFVNLCKDIMTNDVLKSPDNEWVIVDGSPAIIRMSNEAGILPTRNFQSGVFKDVDRIDATAIRKVLVRRRACYSCPMACGNITRIQEGPFAGTMIEGPDYETLVLSGSNCLISDLGAIAKYNLLCDKLGIDTITTGNLIAFAMECYDKEIITKKDTDGLELKFGNVDAYVKMPELIAHRKAIGSTLAEGVQKAAAKIGKGSEDFAVHVKGLEYPGYDPRGSISMALAYATSDRGACHERAWSVGSEAFGKLNPFTTEGKAQLVSSTEDLYAVKWSLIICDFYAIGYPNMSRLISAATGWNINEDELKLIGERIWNLTRMINVREGFVRKDDALPKRIASDPLPEGKANGYVVKPEDFEIMVNDYYKLRGWDSEGRPTKEKLEQLGLSPKS
jgi:aldehyde:ferredoxin oxidoreductase